MGQILVRNLDDAVIAALKRRAGDHGSSLEEEVRQALTASVGLGRQDWLRRIDALHARIGEAPGESTLDILRRDRARDDDAE